MLHLGRAHAQLGDWDAALVALQQVRTLLYETYAASERFTCEFYVLWDVLCRSKFRVIRGQSDGRSLFSEVYRRVCNRQTACCRCQRSTKMMRTCFTYSCLVFYCALFFCVNDLGALVPKVGGGHHENILKQKGFCWGRYPPRQGACIYSCDQTRLTEQQYMLYSQRIFSFAYNP